MNFIRKHKKISILVLCLLIILVLVISIFGRYIRNIIHNYILETKAFYFNSSVLHINGKNYSFQNWDGVNTYTITVDLNNRKTDDIYTTCDITYDVIVDCPETVRCIPSKEHGVIYPGDDTDSYEIAITPLERFGENDVLQFSTSVESTSPYKKTMSANYTLGVQKSNFSYEIVDSANSKFLTLNLQNAISFYEVAESFPDHEAGTTVSTDEYQELDPVDQAKCFSAVVTISYDPHILFVDMTNKNFLNRLNTGYQEQTIGGYQWVSGFSYKMNASSSSSIMFYKNDPTQNYGYPSPNENSIIQVSAELANS